MVEEGKRKACRGEAGEEVKKDSTYKTWCTATSKNSSSTAVASCRGSSGFMAPVLWCVACVCIVVGVDEKEEDGGWKRQKEMLMTLGGENAAVSHCRLAPRLCLCLPYVRGTLPSDMHHSQSVIKLFVLCVSWCLAAPITCPSPAHAHIHSLPPRHITG